MSRNVANLFRDEVSETGPEQTASAAAATFTDPSYVQSAAFSLSGWCVVPAIGGVALLAAFPSKFVLENPANAVPYIMFNAAILLAVSFIGSLILFFIFGRSRPVASIAFVLVITIMSASRFAPSTVPGAQAAIMTAAAAKQTDQLSTPVVDPAAVPRANLAHIAGTADTSSITASTPGEHATPTLSKSAKRWVKTAAQLASTYRSAREAFDNGGGLDISGLTSLRACNDRLALLRRLHIANESFAGYINSGPDTLRRILQEDGVFPENIDGEVQAFVTGFNYDLQVSLRQARAEYIKNAQDMLQLLRDREGQWSVASESALVTFKNERDTRAYRDHAEKAAAAAIRDLELQNSIDSVENPH